MKFDSKKTQPETFAEALLGDTAWLPEPKAEVKKTQENFTEKAVVLESFTRFAEEKIAESPDQTIHFDGGSVSLKPQQAGHEFTPSHLDLRQWQEDFQRRIGADAFRLLISSKIKIKILFYVDELKTETTQEAELPQSEFLCCFDKEVADLFEKMVKAMKLLPTDFALSVVNLAGTPRSLEDLNEEIYYREPDFVVPLGALATQALLGNKERLATIHGKFYPLAALAHKSVQIVPLFHPNVIATNQNMKKSTWADMQKIMQAMGLL